MPLVCVANYSGIDKNKKFGENSEKFGVFSMNLEAQCWVNWLVVSYVASVVSINNVVQWKWCSLIIITFPFDERDARFGVSFALIGSRWGDALFFQEFSLFIRSFQSGPHQRPRRCRLQWNSSSRSPRERAISPCCHAERAEKSDFYLFPDPIWIIFTIWRATFLTDCIRCFNSTVNSVKSCLAAKKQRPLEGGEMVVVV